MLVRTMADSGWCQRILDLLHRTDTLDTNQKVWF